MVCFSDSTKPPPPLSPSFQWNSCNFGFIFMAMQQKLLDG